MSNGREYNVSNVRYCHCRGFKRHLSPNVYLTLQNTQKTETGCSKVNYMDELLQLKVKYHKYHCSKIALSTIVEKNDHILNDDSLCGLMWW